MTYIYVIRRLKVKDIRGSYSGVAINLTLWDVTPYRLVSLLGPKGDVIRSFESSGTTYLQLTCRNIPEELTL